MIYEIKCTVLKGEGKKQTEQILTALANARNPKGALRIFLGKSDELAEFDGNIASLTVTAKPEMVRKGFLGEAVEPKAKAKVAKPAKTEPTVETAAVVAE